MELWLQLASETKQAVATIQPMRLTPSREQWLQVLEKTGGHDFEVLEVQYGPAEKDHFKRGVERVREARGALREGDYDRAVSICRKVLEAAGHELEPGKGEAAFKQLFLSRAGEKRGAEYAGILSRVKQLAGFAIHDFGSPEVYSRQEAQFVVRLTESLLSLASSLANAKDRGSLTAAQP
jgi:hypothetical protein